MHKLEAKNGKLLATCSEGTKCREETEKRYKEEINKQWWTVMEHWRKDVKTNIAITETILTEAWETAV